MPTHTGSVVVLQAGSEPQADNEETLDTMRIREVLSELKAKRRIVDQAIRALEHLQKKYRQFPGPRPEAGAQSRIPIRMPRVENSGSVPDRSRQDGSEQRRRRAKK